MQSDKKLVDIWLTRAEQNDEQVQERLKPLYREYAERNYTVAVFLSGDQDLAKETGALLCHNRRRFAELEVRREREQKEAEGSWGITMTM